VPDRVIILSGKVGSGKTTVASKLAAEFGVELFKTRRFLKQLALNTPAEREALQTFGEKLDRKTGGGWVERGVREFADTLPSSAVILVDAVRVIGQVRALRKAYGRRVFHVHLDASDEELAGVTSNAEAMTCGSSKATLMFNATERSGMSLGLRTQQTW
jgi:adenylosuccinate synthase